MTTPRQLEAKRRNALRSTGPKTAVGKARSSQNALRHGLRSDRPVLPGESPEAWEAHRDGVRRALAPADILEAELADRVALCLWRLRRVTGYETAVTAIGMEEVGEEGLPRPLAKADAALDGVREEHQAGERILRLLRRLLDLEEDERVSGADALGVFEDLWAALPPGTPQDDEAYRLLLADLGVPQEEREAPYDWEGWTVGRVRRGAEQIARQGNTILGRLLHRATRQREATQEYHAEHLPRVEAQLQALRRQVQVRQDRQRLWRILPDAKVLETIARHESHLSRQMLQALHTLDRLQADRKGEPVSPPAALDVTVEGELPAPVTTALEHRGGRRS